MSLHRGAHGAAYRDPRRVEVVETEDVDAEIVGRGPLAMEGINAASLAEEMTRGLRVEAVLGERVLAGEQPEPAFVDLHHQRILAAADRAVARRQLGKISLDLELDGAAVTASEVLARGSAGHGGAVVHTAP